jgi:polyhydroxyalkanoate synthesis regulator phasin
MKTTRRLDDLYYTLLEKLSGLRSTISNLQELAGLTAGLHEQFSEDTTDLMQDLGRQIKTFRGFETQQNDLEDIENRVRKSREKADGLSERLEKARRRVSRLEEREKEWQDSVHYRIRWMWTILGTILGILVAFWLVHVFGNPASSLRLSNKDPVKSSLASLTSVPTSVQSILEDVMGASINSTAMGTPSGGASLSSRISKIMAPSADPTSDVLVKIFDEL